MAHAVQPGSVPSQSATDGRPMLTKCSNCAGTIHRSTSRCPHCHTRTRWSWHPTQSTTRLVVAGGVVLAVAVGWWLRNRR